MADSARDAHEIVLDYSAGRWRARGEGLELAHADLGTLDRLIASTLAERPHVVRAHVRFDTSRLPVWLRQYHTHYFNYVLKIERPRAAGSAPA